MAVGFERCSIAFAVLLVMAEGLVGKRVVETAAEGDDVLDLKLRMVAHQQAIAILRPV